MQISPDIIKACQKGNPTQQKELYLILLPYLRAVCSRYIRNNDAIKDVLQEAFIFIFNNIHTFDANKGLFHKWATRITINATLNYNKKVFKLTTDEFVLTVHDLPDLEGNVSKLLDDELLQILKKMPRDFYDIFNLSVIECYSHKEIGELLNIRESLSRKRLSRAKDWLKKTFINDKKTIIHLQYLISSKYE